MTEANGSQPREKISYGTTEVPILRQNCAEVYAALEPPEAKPYVVAPHGMEPQKIVDFFAPLVPKIEELRKDMLKRFDKGSYGKCAFKTGDVAYVLGRPFMLRVYPLNTSGGKVKAARGRATAKYSIDTSVSLLTLYVVHSKSYDEAKVAFNAYAHKVISNNAHVMVKAFNAKLRPGEPEPPVVLRAMRDKFAGFEAGALWISTSIVPYPPDCLAFAIWRELEKRATVSELEASAMLDSAIPQWRYASELLATKAKPYSNQ